MKYPVFLKGNNTIGVVATSLGATKFPYLQRYLSFKNKFKDLGYNIVRNTYNAKTTKEMTLVDTDLSGQTADGLGLSFDNGLGYYTWSGNVEGFTYAKAEDMIAATKANSLVGDSFHDWLVEIGAIVNGQFADCRGYYRQSDKMCPGAYDPFAAQPE